MVKLPQAPLPPDLNIDEFFTLIRQAGDIGCSKFALCGDGLSVWTKAEGSPVSEADIAIDRFLRKSLTALLPGTGWLSEESVDNKARLAHDYIWLVDPIDGTRDFIKGKNGWAVSVALIYKTEVVLAALYAPITDEFYHAINGQGAWLNGEKITSSMCDNWVGARFPPQCCPPNFPIYTKSTNPIASPCVWRWWPATRPI